MHYYKRHLGDYARDTGHLSILEHGVYTLLIDTYYSKEQAPTEAEAIRWARARTPIEVQAVNSVLVEFFVIDGNRFINRRVEEEIAAYREVAETNRRIAVDREERKRARTEHEPCLERGTDRCESVNLAISHKPVTIKEQKSKSTVRTTSARFHDFWAVYPNKKGKQEAEKRWQRDGLDARADEIIAHVHLMTQRDDGWQRGFAPMGSTYLNQARWTDEPTGPAINRSAPGKQMTGLMALEEMKHGVVPSRGHNGHPEAGVLGLGAAAGWGSPAGHGNGLAGSPRLALGSGNGHAPDSRGVLDLGPDGYRLADTWEAD